MKKQIMSMLIGLLAITLMTGCVLNLSFGGGKKDSTSSTATTNNSNTSNNNQHPAGLQQTVVPTVGQQMIDLKKAKDSGAITDAEYQTQKAKLLGNK